MPTSKHPAGPVGESERAVCLLTPDGLIITFNAATVTLLGKERADIAARHCHEAFGCSTATKNGCPLAKALQSHRKAGARVCHDRGSVDEVAEPLFDASGALTGVMLSVTGASGTTASAPDLLRLARLTAIAQAASGVVHDFNNIFARISGAAYLLKIKLGKEPQDPNLEALTAAIESAIEQGKMLTDHLLEFGRGHELDHSVCGLTEVIEKAVSFSVIGHSVRPVVEIEADLWPVKANVGQIIQLISNLTINAIHASDKDKPIRISAGNLPEQVARAAGLASVKHVRITVQDEGRGMPPEQMERLFEPFFTTKKNGTGLGLATSHLIVKNHGGHIGVTSEVGRGTTFIIHLPAAEVSRETAPV